MNRGSLLRGRGRSIRVNVSCSFCVHSLLIIEKFTILKGGRLVNCKRKVLFKIRKRYRTKILTNVSFSHVVKDLVFKKINNCLHDNFGIIL